MANDININVVAQVQGAIAPLKQVEQQVRRVGGQIDRSTAAVRASGAAYSRNGTQLRRWAKGALQQAGFQVGDFAVQVANGTNGIQAFGQQGSQLLGIFGPVGALLGAAVAIFSAVAVAASKAGGEVQNVGSTLGVLREPLTIAVSAVREFGQIFNNVFPTILQNLDTALIAAGLFAAFLAGKYVVSVAAATAANVTFTGSMYALGVATGTVMKLFKRFLPVAIILAVAKFIEMILAARNALGSFGAVMGLLKDIAVEVFERLRTGFALLGEEIFLATERLKTFFGMASMSESEMDAFRDSLNASWSGLGDGLQSWEEFMAAVRAGTEEVTIFGDAADEALGEAGDAVSEMAKKVQSLEDHISKSMENAFMSIVEGTATAKDAFKSMARSIIAELYRVLVVQRMVASITGAMGFGGGKGTSFLTSLFGGFRAQGGAVSANRPYVVGENGPEMLVPSTSGRVIPNNQMGGGGGQPIIVNQTINVSTGVQQTVRTEIKQLMPQIAESAKQAVVDAKRRGGSYGKAFA